MGHPFFLEIHSISVLKYCEKVLAPGRDLGQKLFFFRIHLLDRCSRGGGGGGGGGGCGLYRSPRREKTAISHLMASDAAPKTGSFALFSFMTS